MLGPSRIVTVSDVSVSNVTSASSCVGVCVELVQVATLQRIHATAVTGFGEVGGTIIAVQTCTDVEVKGIRVCSAQVFAARCFLMR